jgi:His Kinase A (phospho-acceptor) domain
MAAKLEQDAKQRAKEEPDPAVEKTGLPSSYLVAIMHEFWNPLKVIIGFADLMQQETFGPLGSPKYNDYSRDIKQCGEYLLGVISDVLDMSRLEPDWFQIQLAVKVKHATQYQIRARRGEVWAEPHPEASRRLLEMLASFGISRAEEFGISRAEEKPAPVVEKTVLPISDLVARVHAEILQERSAAEVEQNTNLSPHMPSPVEARGTVLWDTAVESLGRSADVMEKLAESTGEAIARIAARGDRIDRIQKETRALLNALVASEADA